MRFEWDEHKCADNIRRRNLDFADARRVFQRPVLRTLGDRHDYGEDRWIGIGMLDSVRIVIIVFVVVDENTTQIFSMRQALTHERRRYQAAFRDEFGSL